MTDIQQQVQEAIDELVESGAERGVQVAVYRHGSPLVDAVAGVADATTGRPVTSDTPFHVTSTGKGLTSTVAHRLVEQGVLAYDTPIVELWPEFGAHGKQHATVQHALTHSVGVPAVPVGTTPEDLCDWEKMCTVIAGAVPWWEPGTKTGYHAQTFGYIVGEIVRRATGHRISQVMREQVAQPLGLADELFLGVPASALNRVAYHEEPEGGMEFTPGMLAAMAEQVPFFRVVDGWTAARPRRCRPPPTATARTCSPRTSPPVASCPPGRSPGCTPRCWTRWTAYGSSHPSGCAPSPP
ncbi:serine hydrolase domain-containing protein [Dactylosporangium cerinum]